MDLIGTKDADLRQVDNDLITPEKQTRRLTLATNETLTDSCGYRVSASTNIISRTKISSVAGVLSEIPSHTL